MLTRRGWFFAGIMSLGVLSLLIVSLVPLDAQTRQAGVPSIAAEKLLSADSVAFASFDGMGTHDEGWKKTAAYESIVKSGLFEFMQKLVVGLLPKQSGDEQKLGMAIAAHVLKHGFTGGLSAGAEPAPWVYGTVVFHNGGDFVKDLNDLVVRSGTRDLDSKRIDDRAVTRFDLGDGVELGWWDETGHLVLTVGMQSINRQLSVAKGETPNITTRKIWTRFHRSSVDFEQIASLCVDGEKLRSSFGGITFPSPSGELTINSMLEIFGLHKVGAIAVQTGFSGNALRTITTIDAPAPRTGIPAMLEGKPFTLAELPKLPVNTTGFYAASFDYSRIFTEVVNIARSIAKIGNEESDVDQAINEINGVLGFRLKEDFFDSLGSIVTLYFDPSALIFYSGTTVAFEVKDAKKLNTVLKVLLEVAQRADARVTSTDKGGYTLHTMTLPGGVPVLPSLAITDKWFLLSLSPQPIDGFVKRQSGMMPAWKPSEEQVASLSKVPTKYTSIYVADPRPSLAMLLGFAPFGFSALEQQLRGQTLPVSAADLPPVEEITQPLFPGVTVTEMTDAGFRTVSHESTPSLSGAGLITMPVAVGLLLPAIQQAREAARRAQSMNNLKQLGLALHNYHANFNEFPSMVFGKNKELKLEERPSFLVSLLPYVEQAALYNKADENEAWDKGTNEEVANNGIGIFLSPSSPGNPNAKYPITNYVGISGLGKDAHKLKASDPKAGVIREEPTKFAEITDGTSNTIMMTDTNKNLGPWAQGGSATTRSLTAKPYINGPDGLGGIHAGGALVLFADGSVRFISNQIAPEIMESLVTISGGEVVGDF